MKEKLAFLLILCLIGVFVLTSGCTQSLTSGNHTQSLTSGDQAFINATVDGIDKIYSIMKSYTEHGQNNEISQLKIDGQNLEIEANNLYNKVNNISVSPDLTLSKQNYLNAMERYEAAGVLVSESIDSYNRGNISESNSKMGEA
ncbi:MAG: hypothetical protein LUO81_02725, partial [Methanoregulaceae archaeon]|nr:hypothetical protein [Methanoregulaceae archaeon]